LLGRVGIRIGEGDGWGKQVYMVVMEGLVVLLSFFNVLFVISERVSFSVSVFLMRWISCFRGANTAFLVNLQRYPFLLLFHQS
jgi:hypothetical protein